MLGGTLLVDPGLDFKVITVQQVQFPALKESGQKEQTAGDTQQGHEGKDNGNGRQVLHQKDQAEKEQLKDSVQVNLALFNESDKDSVWVQAWLLEPQQDSVPELHGRQSGKTHKQKHTVQDWQGQQLEQLQDQQGKTNHQVGKEKSQTSFLHINNVAILVLVGQTVEMDNARNRGGDQPWKTKDTIDKVKHSVQAQIIVVRFPMLELVVGVVDQMPCDTVVKEAKQEGKDGRSSSDNGHPSLSSQVGKVDEPVTSSSGFGLIRTVIREEGFASAVTALERRFKLVRNVQLFSLNVGEQELLDGSGNQHRHGDGKVMNGTADAIVAEKGSVPEASEQKIKAVVPKPRMVLNKATSI